MGERGGGRNELCHLAKLLPVVGFYMEQVGLTGVCVDPPSVRRSLGFVREDLAHPLPPSMTKQGVLAPVWCGLDAKLRSLFSEISTDSIWET